MSPLSHVLWRLVVAALGFVLAATAATVILISGLGVLAAARDLAASPDLVGGSAFVSRMLRGVVVAPPYFTVVVPGWLVAALLGEVAGNRRLVVHLLAGAGVAAGGVLAVLPGVDVSQLQVVAASGFVAGFVHWLVAGRGAGLVPRSDPIRLDAAGDPRSAHAQPFRNGVSDERP